MSMASLVPSLLVCVISIALTSGGQSKVCMSFETHKTGFSSLPYLQTPQESVWRPTSFSNALCFVCSVGFGVLSLSFVLRLVLFDSMVLSDRCCDSIAQ